MKTTRDNYCLGHAGLAAGTLGTFNNAAFVANIQGRAISKGATTNTNTFTTSGSGFVGNLGNNQQSVFFVTMTAAGVIATVQSAIFPSASASGYVPRAVDWPVYADRVVIGAIVISCGAAQTFTVGTSVPGTGNTATFVHVADDYSVPVSI